MKRLSAELEVRLLVAFFFVGAVFGVAVSEVNLPIDSSVWFSAAATLVAAFVGAWSAFKLQDRAKNRENTAQNIAAANRALFTLLWQSNSLKLLQRDFLDTYRESPGRHIEIKPLPPQSEANSKFSLEDLSFMAEPKHQNLLFKLLLEEARYGEAVKTVNMRSQLLTEVQIMIEKRGIMHGGQYSGEELRAAMGDYAYHQLKALTDALYFHVDRTVESTIEAKDELRKALKEIFPNEKFIDYELIG